MPAYLAFVSENEFGNEEPPGFLMHSNTAQGWANGTGPEQDPRNGCMQLQPGVRCQEWLATVMRSEWTGVGRQHSNVLADVAACACMQPTLMPAQG